MTALREPIALIEPANLITASVHPEETWPVLQSMERFATTGLVVIYRY